MKSNLIPHQALNLATNTSIDTKAVPINADFIKRLAVLTRKLGYVFKDPSLPKLALTHRSFDSKKTMSVWSFWVMLY